MKNEPYANFTNGLCKLNYMNRLDFDRISFFLNLKMS